MIDRMRLQELDRSFARSLYVMLVLILTLLQYLRGGAYAVHHHHDSARFKHMAMKGDIHGGVPMGVSNRKCDDAKTNLTIDGDYREPGMEAMYECLEGEFIPVTDIPPKLHNQDKSDQPIHVCMNKAITYLDNPPLSGRHRPLWPVYGEYIYLPPQRWLHSMEHGAVVLLYHPCADPVELSKLKSLVRGCIRRHIITPYRDLPATQPFTLLVWQHKLALSYADRQVVEEFIKNFGISSGLEHVSDDGQYDYGLIQAAEIVSDVHDSNLCPQLSADREEYFPDRL